MQYLITVISQGTDDGTAEERAAVSAFNERLIADGHWVFAGGLDAPSTSTVVDNRGDAPVVTDGPYVETKEHMAGLWIWEAPDLDVALALAAEGSKVCHRRLEVRPLL